MNLLDLTDRRALLGELLRRKAQRAGPLPLSEAQHRLWLISELEPDAADYHVPCAFRLRGELDVDALGQALDAIVRRHDVLRATMRVIDGDPMYVVGEHVSLALRTIDVAPDRSLESILADDANRPFDLRTDIPLRALLARCSATEHVLLLTFHHIATDGWSMGIFKSEFGALYDAFHADRASPLAALDCTYADFVAWQRARSGEADLARQRDYWNAHLADAPPPLELAQRRSPESGVRGGLRAKTLDPAFSARLGMFCGDHGATLFATLFATFTTLLHRYTGSRDFLVGSVLANRTRSEFEHLIGFFVNTLPLRARIVDDPLFADWLARVQALTLDAFDAPDVPFQTLVELASAQRGAARQPLVNVMFVLQNAPDEPLELGGLDVTPIAPERTSAKFDLTLEAEVTAAGLRIAFEYRTDLFDAGTIDAMLEALETLLAQIVADPRRPLSALPWLTPLDRQRQLHAANGPQRPFAVRRIDDSFERQAAATPDAVAIVESGGELSYRRLNERANRLARHVRALGTVDGARIGLCFERGSSAVVAMIAILKAGAVYVPLDPHEPLQRLAHMLSDAGITHVVTDARCAATFARLPVALVRLDRDAPRIETFSAADRRRTGHQSASDPASIMYTSGSTGTPKGVLVAHAGIARLAVDTDTFPIGSADAVAQASTLSFDASTFEIWAALLGGARLVIVPKDVVLAPARLKAVLIRHDVTIMFVTTALMREITRSAPATFASVRRLLVGGEVLDRDTAALLREHAAATLLFNMYGPTETTTFATAYPIVDVPGVGSPPIGRPIANTAVYVLDERLEPLPAGAVGELYIGGPGVAIGYLNDPELTAARFIRDPFSGVPGARCYATGDRARRRPDGNIEFVGRADGQLKIRGFRIEPGEIEAALRACRGIDDAAVIARDDTSGGRRLIAYVTLDASAGVQQATIRAQLRRRVPAFMIPDAIVEMAAFPLKASGKLDRAALPPPPRQGPDATRVAPNDEVQAALATLWQRLLPERAVGVRDNFFDLGGNSLLALRLHGEIEKTFDTRLPPATVFEQPTIEALARALRDDVARVERDPLTVFHAAGALQPLFFLHGSISGGGFYCRALADRLGPDRPLYVLAPHGGAAGPLPSIEAMAADYVGLIRRVQPNGPYVVGGFCAGGLVAFEMAQQLCAAGETIANVILLDVPDASTLVRRIAVALDRVGAALRLRDEPRQRLIGFVSRAPHHARRLTGSDSKIGLLRHEFAKLRRRRTAAPPATPAAVEPDGWVRPWFAPIEAYVPRRYAGPVTLLQTRDLVQPNAAAGGWATFCPNLERRLIPGNHLTCISEFIDDVARAINAGLPAGRR